MSDGSLLARMGGAAARVLIGGLLISAAAGRAGATTITAFPVDFTATETVAFSGAVATFEDDNPAATPADFTATIDWGDGSSPTAGTIGSSSAAFVVSGQHTYADEGSFTVTVTISDVSPGTGTATATDTATVSEADSLSGTPVHFSATIDWGDATTSAGTVSGGSGHFQVSGTHTYAGPGTFTVTVTLSDDKPGTATAQVTSTARVASGLAVSAVSFSTPEHAVFNGTVATFSDSDTTRTPAGFTAVIDWGDGTAPTAGTVSGGSGSFTVSGQHTYQDERTATFTVSVSEVAPPMATASSTATATVTEADGLSGTGAAISAVATQPFTGLVASFHDTDAANTPSDFTATINWGDGNSSAGTVAGGAGNFTVSGTHTYATSGTFTVTVTLTDDAPGTASATATGTASVGMAPVAAIPALGWRGLLLLGVILGGAGLWVLRRG